MKLRTKRFDARAIAYHYDVSNEFYALFLDRRMVYTCAYYRRPDGDLDQAQEDKLDLVCRKLRLQPGERLLDIGCGWGSLVVWAAERYGVLARGVTLSRAQAEYGQAWIRRLGLELQIIFNKGAVMVLPAGVNKATGLTAALTELELSPHEVVGVGDAEVGVERQGVLPVLAGQAVLACCVASVSETGVGAGLLVPVTRLDG